MELIRIPVSVIYGADNGIKVQLIDHIMQHVPQDLSTIIPIVNDTSLPPDTDPATYFSSLNVTRPNNWSLASSSCISYNKEARDGLITHIESLAEQSSSSSSTAAAGSSGGGGGGQYIVFAADASADCMSVGEVFEVDLEEVAYIDTCIMVVKADTLLDTICSLNTLQPPQADNDSDTLYTSETFVHQLETANIIILHNCSALSSPNQLEQIISILTTLKNAAAAIVQIDNNNSFDSIDVDKLVNTGLFDYAAIDSLLDTRLKKTSSSPSSSSEKQQQQRQQKEEHVVRFVYRSRRPFHPQRLHSFFQRHFPLVLTTTTDNNTTTTTTSQTQQKKQDGKSVILRSGGFVWLASSPDVYGDLQQTGSIVRLNDGGIWLAALPAEDVPQDPEERREFEKDFDRCGGPHGDRRQEIFFMITTVSSDISEGSSSSISSISSVSDKISVELDACLVSEEEEKGTTVVQWRRQDPFGPWPTLADLLGDTNTSDTTATTATASTTVLQGQTQHQQLDSVQEEEGDTEDTDTDQQQQGDDDDDSSIEPEGGGLEDFIGKVVNVTEGASEVQDLLDSIDHTALAVVYWHARWIATCEKLEEQNLLTKLATKYPGVAILRINLEESFANRAFANEKVLSPPHAARIGAKPILKSGGRFPCFTLHTVSSLQPMQQIDGDTALETLCGLLEHKQSAGELPEVAFVDLPSRLKDLGLSDDDEEGKNKIVVQELSGGAAQFKQVLSSARDADQHVLVLWTTKLTVLSDNNSTDTVDDTVDQQILQAIQSNTSNTTTPIQIVVANLSSCKPNQVLAKGLKVGTALPEIHLYKDMKLCPGGKLTSTTAATTENTAAAATPDAVVELLTKQLPEGTVGPTLSSATTEQTPGQPTRGEFDPPEGKLGNRKGLTMTMKSGTTGYYFPKMPCLSCGCPWWSSDEWNAVCLRCGWSCERDGYDDDSKPLPAYKAKWERFVTAIKRGRTPEWKGKSAL